jgi:asparagine synthase (glutamine-hydrolysing)
MVRTGRDWGVGVREAATLTGCEQQGATVLIGDVREGGCSATICAEGKEAPRLTLARDPFGLYRVYTAREVDGTLWFASDPRPLRSIVGGGIVAPAALHGYLCFSHVPSPLTLWEGITEGGERAPIPPSAVRESAPWARARELRTLLREAVARRLGQSREVGVYLSGGLDSSLVAALLVEAGAAPHLFTLDFGPPHDAELPLARAVAAHLKRPLHVVSARPADVRAALEGTARALPQPFGDGVTVPLYLLGAAARRHVAEVWNGEGGDQIFGGWANKPMIAALLYGDTSEAREIAEYRETYHRFDKLEDRLYTPALRQATAAARVDAADWIRPALDRETHPTLLHRLRAANLALKGAQNIAPRMVALAACHGLQVRAPFFDRALAEWSFTLSPDLLLAGACEKYLLKSVAADGYLPPEIVWREKRGMGVPTADWCLERGGPLRRETERCLSARAIAAEKRFNAEFVRNLLRGVDPAPQGAFRRRRVGEKIWALLFWETWRKVHGVS